MMSQMSGSSDSSFRTLANQYDLNVVRSETHDEVHYVGTQKDTRREVLIYSLRKSAASDNARCNEFIEDARAKCRVRLPFVASVIELFSENSTWHLVMEGNGPDSLDSAVPKGRKLSGSQMVNLLQKLCKLCLYVEAEGINTHAFRLGGIYLYDKDFLLDNPACAGPRKSNESTRYLTSAAKALLLLLEPAENRLTTAVQDLLLWVAGMPDSCVLVASDILSAISRLPSGVVEEEVLF